MRVTWSIDIDDTDDPREAAAQALGIMQDPGSTAVVFDVDGTTVDLEDVERCEEPDPARSGGEEWVRARDVAVGDLVRHSMQRNGPWWRVVRVEAVNRFGSQYVDMRFDDGDGLTGAPADEMFVRACEPPAEVTARS